MAFDWLRFAQQRHIPYVEKGPNTARGHISIKCPYCGESDPSQHMGLSLKSGVWGCLRNSAHRGRSPVRLVQTLLRCSQQEARRVVGVDADLAPTTDSLATSFAALGQTADAETLPGPLRLLPEFKPLDNGSLMAQPFWDYLRGRGYRDNQIRWLCEQYRLHYALKGDFAYRLIVPIYDRYGELMSWTGRAIRPEAQPRYKTLRVTPREDGEGPVAKLAANNTLLGLPVLWGAANPRVLILVEGPFDALKLTAFGHSLGVYAAAVFGLNVYPAQAGEIDELAQRFDRVYLLVDEDAELQRLRLLQRLPSYVTPLRMSEGADDPGEMSGAQVVEFCMRLLTPA